MQQPVYIRPRVTPRLLLMVTIVSVGLIGLSLGYRASLPSNNPAMGNPAMGNPAMGQMMVWLSLPLIAAIYGMAFSLTWIASAIDLLVWRRLAQLAIAAGAVILLERLGNKNFAHYAITLGGILIFLELWFWCLAIPRWRGFADAGEIGAAKKERVRHQFG